jgi:hypothetical protein
MTTPVTDDVWRALNPHAGRMPRRVTALCVAAACAALATVLVVVGGWRSGIIVPNLGQPFEGGWGVDVDTHEHTFAIVFPIRNNGLIPVEITGLGRDGHGLKLTGARTQTLLRAGESADIRLEYQVTDCAAVQAGDWPVPIRVKRSFGEQTAYVWPPEVTRPDAPSAYSYTGNRNPYAISWQELYGGKACGRFME